MGRQVAHCCRATQSGGGKPCRFTCVFQVESRGKSWRSLQDDFLARQRQIVACNPLSNDGPLGAAHHVSSGRALRPWGAEDLRTAAGSSDARIACHPLRIDSAYRAVTGREAPYTTCHDKFIGTVDFLWYSGLVPVGVVQPPPIELLHSALPSLSWPSDHISLICDFTL